MKASDEYVFLFILADQYARIGRLEKALSSFEKAYDANPEYKQGLIQFANFLFAQGDFKRILELVEPLSETEELQFEYHLLKGKALMGMGRFAEAIESLQSGNQIYNSDIGLLNSLGICYYRTGQVDQALDALNSSLRLDPDQPETKKLVEKLK